MQKAQPIIGIVGSRHGYKSSSSFYDDVISSVEKSGAESVGILYSDSEEKIDTRILDICDGFIFQGGSEIDSYRLDILDYADRHKKPVFGICLGIEIIATYYFGVGSVVMIDDVDREDKSINHHSMPEEGANHIVNINPSGSLHKLFGDSVLVNSRHTRTVVGAKEPFMVAAESEDKLIEAIELDKDGKYILGVQWHPENMENMLPLFRLFVQKCKK